MSKPRRPYRAVLTVRDTCYQNHITNAYQLHKKTGLSIPRAKKLWKGEGKFDLDDLTALCNCIPCSLKDIIQLVPVEESELVSKCDQENFK